VEISIIVACAQGGVIGAEGGIPWRLPDDQQYFKRVTLGHCIVMGRGTHESIGRLLPGRTTIIVTRNPEYEVPGANVVQSFEAALAVAHAADESELFVVGGAQIYALALPHATRLHLTRVDARIDGDVRFDDPTVGTDEAGSAWQQTRAEPHAVDARHAHPFTIEVWERATSASSLSPG
jgi:dihydrofolate reductase